MSPAQVKVWSGKINSHEVSIWRAENYQENVCALGDVFSQEQFSTFDFDSLKAEPLFQVGKIFMGSNLVYIKSIIAKVSAFSSKCRNCCFTWQNSFKGLENTSNQHPLVHAMSKDAVKPPKATRLLGFIDKQLQYEIHELEPESGYVCLGDILVEKGVRKNIVNKYCCVKEDLTVIGEVRNDFDAIYNLSVFWTCRVLEEKKWDSAKSQISKLEAEILNTTRYEQ